MTSSKDPLTTMAGLMGEWTQASVEAETSALAILKAEMEGLTVLFGGSPPAETAQERLAEEAAIEAGFDNMPI